MLVGLTTAVATLPYLALKTAWTAGSTVGMADPAVFDNPTYRIGNGLTLIADALVIALGLALTFPWGLRLPAWLVLLPVWVAVGLLGPILALVLAVPFTFDTGGHAADDGGRDALRGWVYAVVYGGFAVQGTLLLAAFVGYSRRRWSALFRPAGPSRERSSSAWLRGRRQTLLIRLGVTLATIAGIVNLAWGAGVTVGLGHATAQQASSRRALFCVLGAFALAAVVGVVLLNRRWSLGRPLWWPAVLIMAGTGSMFAWSAYMLVTAIAGPAAASPCLNVVNVLRVGAAVFLLTGVRSAFGQPGHATGRSTVSSTDASK